MNTSSYKIANPLRFAVVVFAIIVLVTTAILGIGALSTKQPPAVASIPTGMSYLGTTTYNGAGAPNLQRDVILKTSAGTLGSFIITGAVAGTVTFYDATTTDPTKTTLGASSTLAIFPVSAAANTYTFDRAFYNGLVVSFGSATALPTSTITYR